MSTKHNITNRGKSWEILNSWWIALSFIGLAWVGFFIIGGKAKQKKWIVCAIVFTFIQFVVPILGGNANGTMRDIWSVTWVIGYIVGIVLSFAFRKQYLVCRDSVLNDNTSTKFNQKLASEQTASVYKTQTVDATRQNYKAEPGHMRRVETFNPSNAGMNTLNKVIDVNTCSELDFINLPGFTAEMAKTAAQYREAHHGFISTDEFMAIAQVKPHMMDKVNEVIKCGNFPKENQDEGSQPFAEKNEDEAKIHGGRKLDF